MKAFADDIKNLCKKLKFVLGMAENIVEKEKMLETIFSFPHNVFKRLLSQSCLTLYHIIPTFKDPEKEAI